MGIIITYVPITNLCVNNVFYDFVILWNIMGRRLSICWIMNLAQSLYIRGWIIIWTKLEIPPPNPSSILYPLLLPPCTVIVSFWIFQEPLKAHLKKCNSSIEPVFYAKFCDISHYFYCWSYNSHKYRGWWVSQTVARLNWARGGNRKFDMKTLI